MNKYLLIIAKYPDWRQEFFNELILPRTKEYCSIHEYELIYINKGINKIRGSYTWNKPFIIEEMLNNTLSEGDTLTSFDADAIVVDKYKDFIPPAGKSFTYAIDTANTHNMGFYSLVNNKWTRDLFKNIVSEERYIKLSQKLTYHPGLNNYSMFWNDLPHQASVYSLFGIKRHSDSSFLKEENYGWNSSVDEDTIYKIKELHEKVHILGSNWNVTEVPGESSCVFYVNKTSYNKVIIRHFAGPQQWRDIWLEKGKIKFHLHFLKPSRLFKNFVKGLLR
jgi:hypothetical protein